MKFNVEQYRIFECITGSRLYGLANKFSDIDYRGVCLPPIDVLLNPFESFEQKDSGFDEEDRVIYALPKFMKLCADGNPNIIELLFIPETHVVYITDTWKKILKNKQYFISKKVKHTFTGYAFSQLNRIERHRRWLLNPISKPPSREDFGLPIMPEFGFEKLNNILHAPKETIKEEYRDYASKEIAYRNKKDDYDQYQNWFKNRNPDRFALEEKFGYDCYVINTEFLTKNGWKFYDEINDSDLLATVNKFTHEIEYQKTLNRFKYLINDYIYDIKTQITHAQVTKNHNLFVSNQHRSKTNNFSRKYDVNKSDWNLIQCEEILNNYRSNFHIINRPNNFNDEYDISDDYLKIMGLYVSEGSIIKYKGKNKNTIKGVSISQLEIPNKISNVIDDIESYDIKKYRHKRKGRIEITYNIYDKNLAKRLHDECEEYSSEKKLPFWILNLSKRQANILLNSLISGDGTIKKCSRIYYTASKKLADMIQVLSILAGFSSKIWNYKENYGIYQVYISDYYGQYGNLKKSQIKKNKYSGYVVCFEVDNSVLITRLNGEIAIYGNSKHASHLFRLMTEGKELLLTGNITFPLPNADEILAIKNGAYSYSYMIEKAKSMEKDFEQWYEISKLPITPDRKALTDLYFDVILS